MVAKALLLTKNGWPINRCADHDLKPYLHTRTRKHELSVEQGCLMWGLRTVIPPSLRQTILAELYEGHPGIACMKSIARSHVWWPKIDQEIEKVKKNPQGSSSLTASSMVLADSSMATCSRRFCHPSGKTLPHHGRRPL